MTTMGRLVFSLMAAGVSLRMIVAEPPSDSDIAPLRAMIARQKSIRTLSADYTQTRSLRTLRSPLLSRGCLWYEAPDSFRWETTEPARSILVGTPSGTTLLRREGNKNVAKSIASGSPDGIGMAGMSSLSRGDFDAFRRSFRILSLTTKGANSAARLQPLSGDAARGIDEISIEFDTATGEWISLGVRIRDGSSLIWKFSNVRINPKLPAGLFDPDHLVLNP